MGIESERLRVGVCEWKLDSGGVKMEAGEWRIESDGLGVEG